MSGPPLSPERLKALAYLQQKMNVAEEKVREIEEMVFEQYGVCSVRQYRSQIRTSALEGTRSTAQSPPPVPRKMLSTTTLPKCKGCKSNANVAFKFEQRRSGDEGMTAGYTCSKCSVYWT